MKPDAATESMPFEFGGGVERDITHRLAMSTSQAVAQKPQTTVVWALYRSLPDAPAPVTLWILECCQGWGVPRELAQPTFYENLVAARAALPQGLTRHDPDPKEDGPDMIEVWG